MIRMPFTVPEDPSTRLAKARRTILRYAPLDPVRRARVQKAVVDALHELAGVTPPGDTLAALREEGRRLASIRDDLIVTGLELGVAFELEGIACSHDPRVFRTYAGRLTAKCVDCGEILEES